MTLEDLLQLPTLVPNINNICLSYSLLETINEQELPPSTIELNSFLLNHIIDYKHNDHESSELSYQIHPSIHQFIKSITQSRYLKKLSFKYLNDDYRLFFNAVLPHLSNLTSLHLGLLESNRMHGRFSSKKKFIETLHDFCPQLESLECTLTGKSIKKDDFELGKHRLYTSSSSSSSMQRNETILKDWKHDIRPWYSLKSFSVTCDYDTLDMQYFLLYLSIKMKNLKKLLISNTDTTNDTPLYAQNRNVEYPIIILSDNSKKVFSFPFLKSIRLVQLNLVETIADILFGSKINNSQDLQPSSPSSSSSNNNNRDIDDNYTFKEISLSNCIHCLNRERIFSSFLRKYLTSFESLTTLEISDHPGFIVNILNIMEERIFKSITHLTISTQNSIITALTAFSGPRRDKSISFYRILTTFPKLIYLKIEGLSIKIYSNNHNYLQHLSPDYPLQHLHIDGIPQMNPNAFEEVSYLCRDLKTLYIKDVNFVYCEMDESEVLNSWTINDLNEYFIHHLSKSDAKNTDKKKQEKEKFELYNQYQTFINQYQTQLSTRKKIVTCISLPWSDLKECTFVNRIYQKYPRYSSSIYCYLIQQSIVPLHYQHCKLYHHHTDFEKQLHIPNLYQVNNNKSVEQYNLYWLKESQNGDLIDAYQYNQYDTFEVMKALPTVNTKYKKHPILSKAQWQCLKKDCTLAFQCKSVSSVQFLSL
ncbi:unnamed protein product [Cunninghamella blakesleeana]